MEQLDYDIIFNAYDHFMLFFIFSCGITTHI